MKVSIKEFAEMLDVSQPAISRKIKLGQLGDAVIKGENGRIIIDSDRALANLKKTQTRDVTLVKQAQRETARRKLTEAGQDAGVDPAEMTVEVVTDIGPAKAKRESYLAEIARLEYEEAIKKLVKVEEVQKQAFTMFRECRDALMNIPGKCAPELASMDDVFEITQFLDKFVREVLTDLNQSLVSKYEVEDGE